MGYKINYKSSVNRDLKKLDKKEVKRILDQVERELSTKPEIFPELKGKFAGLRKMRWGEYRVIFAVLEVEVLVLRIGHRKDVYKK